MRAVQNIKKITLKALIIPLLLAGLVFVALPPVHSAAAPSNNDKSSGSGGSGGSGGGGGSGGNGGNNGGSGGGGGGNNTPTRSNSIRTAGNQSDITSSSLPQTNANDNTIKHVLQFFFALIGAFAVLNITLSGLKYITSSGDAQKTSEAKNGIVYALLGLALAITAEAIVTFVVSRA